MADRCRLEAEERRESGAEERRESEAERREAGGMEESKAGSREAGEMEESKAGSREAEEMEGGEAERREAEGKEASEAERRRGKSRFDSGVDVRDLVLRVEGKKGYGAEECHSGGDRGIGAEEMEVSTMAIVLAKSLGLGGSSDSDGGFVCELGLGAEGPLDTVADERHLVDVGESSYRGGECESEGLTEEVGAVRGEMFDSGTVDEEWRKKTLALNGEDVANSIYHVPKGYRLHLPSKGSSIHYPPDGHVGFI